MMYLCIPWGQRVNGRCTFVIQQRRSEADLIASSKRNRSFLYLQRHRIPKAHGESGLQKSRSEGWVSGGSDEKLLWETIWVSGGAYAPSASQLVSNRAQF